MNEEKVIMRYIFSKRSPFCLQEVTDNTNIDKTKCFHTLQKLLENEEIERVCEGSKPKLYRYVGKKDKTQAEKELQERKKKYFRKKRRPNYKPISNVHSMDQETIQQKVDEVNGCDPKAWEV